MTPLLIGIVGIGAVLLLMALGMRIGFAMGLIGFLGFAYLSRFKSAFHIMGDIPFNLISNYDFCVLPLFFLMASVCSESGLGKSLYRWANSFIGHLRGGLAVATIAACAMFAAASASTIATAMTIGKVAIPEMKSYGYDNRLVCGSVAAGGTLGILIPPSGIFIIYGIITEQPIDKLFIAGIIPGIILALLMIILIISWAKVNPSLAPKASSTTIKEKTRAFLEAIEMIFLLLLIIVGLIVGWFSPTEAGAVGACGAIIFSLFRMRLSFNRFKVAILETLMSSGMVFTLLIGALIFNTFLAVSTLPMELARWISGLGLPPLAVMMGIICVYIVLGCFIDALSMVLLTVPIFFPIIKALGYNPIWFGVIIVIMVETAAITPPVGMNVYVVHGISQDIPMEEIFRGIFPFLIALSLIITLLLAFPQIALLLVGN